MSKSLSAGAEGGCQVLVPEGVAVQGVLHRNPHSAVAVLSSVRHFRGSVRCPPFCDKQILSSLKSLTKPPGC